MKLTIEVDEADARYVVERYSSHNIVSPLFSLSQVANAIEAALSPEGRPLTPGDQIALNGMGGTFFAWHRNKAVIWWDGYSAASSYDIKPSWTHAGGSPITIETTS